jgi:hypothetical protein
MESPHCLKQKSHTHSGLITSFVCQLETEASLWSLHMFLDHPSHEQHSVQQRTNGPGFWMDNPLTKDTLTSKLCCIQLTSVSVVVLVIYSVYVRYAVFLC